MRPSVIEVLDIGVKYAVEPLLMQDEHVIKALSTHASQKPFTDGIRSPGLRRYFENLDVTRIRHPHEAHPKRAIMITDEVLRPLAKGASLPQRLCGPSVGRTSFEADVDHSARLQFEHEEGEKRTEEEIRDGETRRRPTYAQHDGVRSCSTSCTVYDTPFEDELVTALRFDAPSGKSARASNAVTYAQRPLLAADIISSHHNGTASKQGNYSRILQR
jgi:hypothetical protein